MKTQNKQVTAQETRKMFSLTIAHPAAFKLLVFLTLQLELALRTQWGLNLLSILLSSTEPSIL